MSHHDEEFTLMHKKGEYSSEEIFEATSLDEIREFIEAKEGSR